MFNSHMHNKLMRKVKKAWVTLTVVGLVGAITVPAGLTVFGEDFQDVIEAMAKDEASDFEDKETLAEDELVREESQKAIDFAKTDKKVQIRTISETKEEIERQKELELPVYVVQKGDNLLVLSEACEKTMKELAEANKIDEQDELVVGDILVEVLMTEDERQEMMAAKEAEAK